MFKVSYRLPLLVANTLRSRCNFPLICAKTLEYSRPPQSTPLIISHRLAHSTSNLPNPEQEQIYAGPMASKVKMIKMVTMATSLFSIPFQFYVLYSKEEFVRSLPGQVMMITMIVFQALMPFLIHHVAKRYVVRMYHNAVTDKYTIETYNLYPTLKYTTFRASECRPPKVEVFATVVIREKIPIFLDPHHFTDVEHYKRLLGYDKPIDFSVGEDETETTGITSESTNDVRDKEKKSK